MSESNFRTEVVGLFRDALSAYRSWRDSTTTGSHLSAPDIPLPPGAEIDFSTYRFLTDSQKRDVLHRAMQATKDVDVYSSDSVVPLLLVNLYRVQLQNQLQQIEIDELQTRLELLEKANCK